LYFLYTNQFPLRLKLLIECLKPFRMNILLIGSGGREHAIVNALIKKSAFTNLFVAPGNPGMADRAVRVTLDLSNHQAIADFCKISNIGFVIIGPEGPLVAGLVDDLAYHGIRAFGPRRAAAELEGSKTFTKDFCTQFSIPTAAYACFTDAAAAKTYVRAKPLPIVVKADGLAAGKGVTVAQSLKEAEHAIDHIFEGGFGTAGHALVIEDFLEGEELSFFALCDGHRALAFNSAQDHKRVGDNDTGPNTGGMGAYSPTRLMDKAMTDRVMNEIINPTLKGMAELGRPFQGVLFAGLMIGPDGPKLIEYNVRFGDPESQAMLPRLEEDLLSLMLACCEGHLPKGPLKFSSDAAICIVLAAKGYPDAPEWGSEIGSLAKAESVEGVILTHAGTKKVGTKLLANGGRVLNVTGLGKDLAKARKRAYMAIDLIDWPQGFCRRDIGSKACEVDAGFSLKK
jgi:phosphoribosylamine--glycine ligase